MVIYLKNAFLIPFIHISKTIIYFFRSNQNFVNKIFRYPSFFRSHPLETCAVIIDISKTFPRVWDEGLLFKLRHYGIQDHLLNLIKSFLSNRLQRVVLNVHCTTWEYVLAGVPQGSILGSLFFHLFSLMIYLMVFNLLLKYFLMRLPSLVNVSKRFSFRLLQYIITLKMLFLLYRMKLTCKPRRRQLHKTLGSDCLQTHVLCRNINVAKSQWAISTVTSPPISAEKAIYIAFTGWIIFTNDIRWRLVFKVLSWQTNWSFYSRFAFWLL